MTLPPRFQKLKELSVQSVHPAPWEAERGLVQPNQRRVISNEGPITGEIDRSEAELIAESRNQIDDLLKCLEVALEGIEFYEGLYRGPSGRDKSAWYGQKAREIINKIESGEFGDEK